MTNNWVVNSLMKPIYVDELFNRRFIICELEYILNDDDKIDTSFVAQRKIEASIVSELSQEYDITVGEVDEEVEDTVVPEKQNEESRMNI